MAPETPHTRKPSKPSKPSKDHGTFALTNRLAQVELRSTLPGPCEPTGHRAGVRSWGLPAVLVLVIALAGCGSSSSSAAHAGTGSAPQHVHFAKTKFLLHAGLAFGAFHRYIYKPFRSGGFNPPARHKLAIVKAGAAALFAYHEIKIALIDAQSSPLLSKLVSPITGLQTRLSSLGHHLHGGQLNPAEINATNTNVTSIGTLGAQNGAPIHDLATSALGH